MDGSSDFPPEYLITGETSGKYLDIMSVVPDDVEELIPNVPIGEERVEKFMQELYREMTAASSTSSATYTEMPSWTAAGYAATGSCLRWNSWESESCGAAVSDSTSTVMAGVEYAGQMVPVSVTAPGIGGRCGCKCGSNGELVVAAAGNGEGGKINGCEGCGGGEDQKVDGEDEEEWFARVLSWGPADLVPGFWNDVHGGGTS